MTTTMTEAPAQLDVEAAWQAYCLAEQAPDGWGLLAAVVALDAAAQAADQRLCQWGCLSPHQVTVRSCCQSAHCDLHEEDHDEHCPEFHAQLREEAL